MEVEIWCKTEKDLSKPERIWINPDPELLISHFQGVTGIILERIQSSQESILEWNETQLQKNVWYTPCVKASEEFCVFYFIPFLERLWERYFADEEETVAQRNQATFQKSDTGKWQG